MSGCFLTPVEIWIAIRHNYRVFLLLTHSVAGGLPLGVLITPNEQSSTIKAALRLYSTLLDATCFYGRGTRGPTAFMTDDATAERQALAAVYPESARLLCVFHILQAHWRYLWANENHVHKDHRQHLFHVLKNLVYANCIETMDELYTAAMTDAVVCSYSKVRKHLESLYERREEWALCCRSALLVRSNNTNNYCESAMRVLKDNVLHRTKAFNVQQLVDFIVTRYDSHYQRRMLDVANNRLDYVRSSRFIPSRTTVAHDQITQLAEHQYEVPSQSNTDVMYTVDMFVGHCTCHAGNTGGPCKHQAAVMSAFKLPSWNVLPVCDPAGRKLLHQIAVGDEASVPDDWFKSLRPSSDVDVPPATAASACPSLPPPVDEMDVEDELVEADETLFNRFGAAVEKINAMYRSDPLSFGPAMESFCKRMDSMSTPAAVQSALHCFGKYSGLSRQMAGLKTISVQPTAVARRKALLGGRKRTYLGRTPRWAFTPEHGYANKPGSRHFMPKRRAPHSLSSAVYCVEPLGRTHSAK